MMSADLPRPLINTLTPSAASARVGETDAIGGAGDDGITVL